MTSFNTTYDGPALGGEATAHDDARKLLGQVMGYVAGLGIFGALTIYDFNRLRRSTPDAAVPIAAGIFLDVFNVFLLALELFGGRRD
jgi:hypothetical protein